MDVLQDVADDKYEDGDTSDSTSSSSSEDSAPEDEEEAPEEPPEGDEDLEIPEEPEEPEEPDEVVEDDVVEVEELEITATCYESERVTAERHAWCEDPNHLHYNKSYQYQITQGFSSKLSNVCTNIGRRLCKKRALVSWPIAV